MEFLSLFKMSVLLPSLIILSLKLSASYSPHDMTSSDYWASAPVKRTILSGQHYTPITAVALNEQNQEILTGDSEGSIFVWNKKKGSLKTAVGTYAEETPILDIAVAQDGSFIVAERHKLSCY